MPSTRSLDLLRSQLQTRLAPRTIFSAPVWGDPRPMSEMLKVIKRDLGNDLAGMDDTDKLQDAVISFARDAEVRNFTQLKYLCHGLLIPIGKDSWCLLDREPLLLRLLANVEKQRAQPRQFRRGYQGLLSCYFGYILDPAEEQTPRHRNWIQLRAFLAKHLDTVASDAVQRSTAPEWLGLLIAHRNLLTATPCDRYASALMHSNTRELQEVCDGLGISAESWVWPVALLAYVKQVCAGNDPVFLANLPDVLKLANGQKELKLSETLARQATVQAVLRYARCADKPEHNNLRDTCLQLIGNPWINRTAWDAHVNHEPTRQMVESWLKRRLIRDFFELLAHDGGADVRRLNYWLKWEPQISDMWFVLGSDARRNQSAAFDSVRKRMQGRSRKLDDNNDQNNAFVMRIGPLLVIEFGMTGNACFVFAASDFKTDLKQEWLKTNWELKQRSNQVARLTHQGSWEGNFDYQLRRALSYFPASRSDHDTNANTPAQSTQMTEALEELRQAAAALRDESTTLSKIPAVLASATDFDSYSVSALSGGPLLDTHLKLIAKRCDSLGIEWEDNLKKNGAFWVMLPDRTSHKGFSSMLEKIGFNFSPKSGGFWYKPKK